ncbi:ribonuclease H-like domain-containing protein [Tanacetum coccineum]
MVTRSQSGIVKPVDRLSLHTSSISHISKSPFRALKDLHWCNAMYDEYNALHKFHADGTLSRYKARLVANDSSQQLGVDFDRAFSPVVKSVTIHMVLSLVMSHKCLIHQLDIKNAFLNSDLSEIVYMHQPPGFVDSRYPHHVCLLQRSLYELKQEPRAWFQRFAGYAIRRKYVLQLLERAHMVNCNPSRTPVDTDSKLGPEGVPGTLDFGLHLYASATTSLVGYTDVDWASCPFTRSAEAEYQGVANIVAEMAWLCNLLVSYILLYRLPPLSTLITLEFYMYPPVITMPISSSRDYPRPCLKNFDPV